MVTGVEPPELAMLLDAAERPRSQNWSLRAALTRYAQPQPQRASDVIELMRRIESALRPHSTLFERDGGAIWDAMRSDGGSHATHGHLVEVLRALAEIDRLGDAIVAWAVARARERPDAMVDAVVADVGRRLDGLGVRREERRPPSGRRG